MLEQIKALVFDIDEVLIFNKDENGHLIWFNGMEKCLGIKDEKQIEKIYLGHKKLIEDMKRGKKDVRDLIKSTLKQTGDNINIEAFLNHFFTQDRNINTPLLEIVKRLKTQGYKLFIASHREKEIANHAWYDLNFKKYFENIFIPEYVKGYIKRELEFFKIVEQSIGLKSNELMLIDDNLENIKTATESGWQTYHYINYDKAQKELFEKLLKKSDSDFS